MESDSDMRGFLIILALIDTLQKQLTDAPNQYKVISDDVKRLSDVICLIQNQKSENNLEDEQKQTLDSIANGCRGLLGDLSCHLDAAPNDLDPNDRVGCQIGQNYIDTFRKRISAEIDAFDLFLDTATSHLSRGNEDMAVMTHQETNQASQGSDEQERWNEFLGQLHEIDASCAEAMVQIERQLPDEIRTAKEVLSWISCATRPLISSELCHALAIKDGSPDLNEGNVPDIDDIINTCAGLVSVDEQSNAFRLTHHTVQEHFERNWARVSPNAHSEIGIKCIHYLYMEAFQNGATTSLDEYTVRLQKYPFFKYAASNWGFHIQQQEVELGVIMKLLEDEGKVNACAQALMEPPDGFFSLDVSFKDALNYMHGIHLAAYLGLLQATKTLAYQAQKHSVDCTNTNGEAPLHLAAKQGHEKIARFLLEQRASINVQDNSGQTPLHIAVKKNHQALIKIFLEAEADIETTGKSDGGFFRLNHTPLMSAATAGNAALVKLLLEAGANPDHCTDRSSPLVAAIDSRDMETFTLLLDIVADPDQADEDGKTPLMHAVERSSNMAKLLLERGARPNAEDNHGESPLSITSQRANESMFKLLLEKTPGQDHVNAKGQGLLHFAAGSDLQGGDENMVRILLEREGLTHERKVADAQSGLQSAAWRGYTNILDILLGIDGVDVNSKDKHGYTALYLAARWGNEDTVALLIDKYRANLEINNNNDTGWTALHGTIIFKKPAIARMLLDRGANVNSRDYIGQTPLTYAMNIDWEDDWEINPQLVQMLLDTDGVDINTRDKNSITPLYSTLLSALTLIHAPDKVDMYEATVQQLLERGARVDIRDTTGRTPIFYAAMLRRAALVEMLLVRGAEPDCKDAEGRTPLSYAVEPFNLTCLPGYEDEREEDPDWATWEPDWSGDQLIKVVGALLAHGADPKSQDLRGLTPLLRAERKLQDSEVLLLLRDAAGRLSRL